MTKIVTCAAVLGLLVASSAAALAKGPGGVGGGASSFSPGHEFRTNGPVTSGPTAGPGASGYAPGRQYINNGAVSGSPGASGYAPGHRK
jgi:hypothetical protein